MDELIAQFAIEARELVQQASSDFLSLESNPTAHETLESAFRAMHTLKGSVGLFDLGPMQRVLHHAEDLLAQARSGNLTLDGAAIDALLATIEWVDDSIDGISQIGRLSDVQESQVARLIGLLTDEIADQENGATPVAPRGIPDWATSLQGAANLHTSQPLTAIRYEPHPECFFNGDDPLLAITRLPDLRQLVISLKEPPASLRDYDPFRCNLIIEAVTGASRAEAEGIFRLIPDQVELVSLTNGAGSRSQESAPSFAPPADRKTTTMRVEATRIDKLIEIAGELITAKNALVPIAADARRQGHSALARQITSSHTEIERLVGSLYSAATQARMIPLEHTFRRFPRLVRETAARLEKALDLVIEGETVEADREIVDSLFEPLLHLIRNGLDHGIESEAHRLQASKPARGRIDLRARQRGDQIEIEVTDDGRGISAEHIKEKAIARGLVSASQSSSFSEREILQFVFEPGFSTASSISELSGRGVGLDVVRRSVQRLGGTVEMQSVFGGGTSFLLKLPISFSMTQLMVVEVGAERYGIPLSDVVETHKLPVSDIQAIRSGRAFILRHQTIPLLDLAELLQMPASRPASRDLKVIVVESGGQRFGIAINAIAERAETLTRPLTGLLQGVTGIAGTTLLGDGRVLLVLNLEELVQ